MPGTYRCRASPASLVYGDVGNPSSYLQVGVVASCIFAISNVFRGEYRLPNFFAFRPHARRTIQLWNVTTICLLMLGFLAHITVDYSRGWILVFYLATLAGLIVLRFLIVRITALARAAGLISAHRIFLIGTGAHISSFVHHYEPWTLGLNVIGCRFLTPVPASTTAEERRAALFAAPALIALTPLIVIIAILIKLDSPGPIFFLQRRYGFNQQPFRIIKFRTCVPSTTAPSCRRRGAAIRA